MYILKKKKNYGNYGGKKESGLTTETVSLATLSGVITSSSMRNKQTWKSELILRPL